MTNITPEQIIEALVKSGKTDCEFVNDEAADAVCIDGWFDIEHMCKILNETSK